MGIMAYSWLLQKSRPGGLLATSVSVNVFDIVFEVLQDIPLPEGLSQAFHLAEVKVIIKAFPV